MSNHIAENKAFSASEIVAMRLPGLPTTVANIHARAKAEGWTFKTTVGLGGVRKLYDVPSKYLEGSHEAKSHTVAPRTSKKDAVKMDALDTKWSADKVAGTVVAGSSQGDLDRIQLVVRAVSEWEAERGIKISDERRPAVIAVLYDYLKKAEEAGEGSAGLDRFLAALG